MPINNLTVTKERLTMGQNINFESILNGITNIATSLVNSASQTETEAPLFEEQGSNIAQTAMEFVSVLGDVSSSDNSAQSLANAAGSITNIISTVLGGSDAVTAKDANNIGSAVKVLAENFAGKLIDESPLAQTGNEEFTSLVKTSLSSNLQSLATTGNINVMGISISAGGLLNFGINTFSNMSNASSNVLSSVITGSIDLLSGNKTIDDAVSGIIKTVQNETKTLNEKTDEGLDQLAEESGYNRDEVEGRLGDFVKSSIGTFVSSFITNGIKTALTNPASLSNPVVFLTATLTSTVTSRTFQTKMLSNVSSLMTGQEQNANNANNQGDLDIAGFINLVANSDNVRNMIASMVAKV